MYTKFDLCSKTLKLLGRIAHCESYGLALGLGLTYLSLLSPVTLQEVICIATGDSLLTSVSIIGFEKDLVIHRAIFLSVWRHPQDLRKTYLLDIGFY